MNPSQKKRITHVYSETSERFFPWICAVLSFRGEIAIQLFWRIKSIPVAFFSDLCPIFLSQNSSVYVIIAPKINGQTKHQH